MKTAKPRALALLAPALAELVGHVEAHAARVAAGLQRDQEDEEAVHDFRVALRRLRTLLRPARPLLGREEAREIGRQLGDLGRRTGKLRDEEVLRETLLGLSLPPEARAPLERWLAQRARGERRMRRAAAGELSGPVLRAVLERLRACLAAPRRDAGIRRFARRALARPLDEARALARAPVTRVAEMHELRIRVKRVRYAAELLAREPAWAARWSPVATAAASLQKRLGALHDLDEARLRLERGRALPVGARRHAARAVRAARVQLAATLRPTLRLEIEALGAAAAAALEAGFALTAGS